MVHFPGLTRTRLCIQRAVTWFYQDRFPYSEIPGSKPACGSPRLIAACHVLHRLLAPRHPPYALSSLTIKLTQHVAIAGLWMITHAEVRHRAWSKFAFPSRYWFTIGRQRVFSLGDAAQGDVAQLGEHLLCKQGVAGSTPVISTTGRSDRDCCGSGRAAL